MCMQHTQTAAASNPWVPASRCRCSSVCTRSSLNPAESTARGFGYRVNAIVTSFHNITAASFHCMPADRHAELVLLSPKALPVPQLLDRAGRSRRPCVRKRLSIIQPAAMDVRRGGSVPSRRESRGECVTRGSEFVTRARRTPSSSRVRRTTLAHGRTLAALEVREVQARKGRRS